MRNCVGAPVAERVPGRDAIGARTTPARLSCGHRARSHTVVASTELLSMKSPVIAVTFALVAHGAFASSSSRLALAEISNADRIQTLITQGVAEMDANRSDKAIVLFEQALAIQPGDLGLQNARAAVLIQLGRIDEARESLRAVLAEHPQFFEADFNLGETFMQEGDYAAALQHYLRMSRIHGLGPLLRFKILLAELLTEQRPAAEVTARGFRYPADGPAWYFAHAALAANEGDKQAARRLRKTAKALHGPATRLFDESLTTTGILK